MAEVYSGKYVSEYIIEITPDEDNVPWSWLSLFVKPNKWVLSEIAIADLLKDPAFREAVDMELPRMSNEDYVYRYDSYDVDPEDVFNLPIVFYDAEEAIVIDGYSRAIQHIVLGKDTIDAYVLAPESIKKILSK